MLGNAEDYMEHGGPLPEETKLLIKYLRELVGDNYMIHYHGDGTFAIPDGEKCMNLPMPLPTIVRVSKRKPKMAEAAIKRNRQLAEAGVDCLILCSDYCYNSGPFLSPAMFEEFIQPYLYRL